MKHFWIPVQILDKFYEGNNPNKQLIYFLERRDGEKTYLPLLGEERNIATLNLQPIFVHLATTYL